MGFILAADTGGTFTDLAAFDTDSGDLRYVKSLTTYDDLVNGVMNCVGEADIDLARADIVKFGTTLVINTYVQRNGAKTALITTEGFKDVLDVRRGNRSSPFDLRYLRDAPLVPREHRIEAVERLDAEGNVLTALDDGELDRLAELVRRLDVEAVAVSFVNSYMNAEHEQRAVSALRAHLPDIYVTSGTELSREWYEYERTSTAVANAYVGPKLNDYVSRLQHRLHAEGLTKSFYLMASNGGAFTVSRACQQPVMLVESGPVGGCIGAGIYALQLGLQKVIAFDMGGTTAKCAVIEDGRFEVRSPYYVGGTDMGFPVRGGVLDIIEVGTGGGSIAWIDGQGRLSVGPKSAGSTPGPVCYGRGGTEPTMTDANLALGRLGVTSFLGGGMHVDADAARRAIGALGERLGIEDGRADQVAEGILALGSLSMASAIKQVTVERGLDPAEFALFAFGGGGPVHAAALARELSISHVIIPPEPGNFSAVGMLLANARIDDAATFVRRLSEDSISEMVEQFSQMEALKRAELAEEFGSTDIRIERYAELRFKGQKHSIKVPLQEPIDPISVRSAFEDRYKRRYGHVDSNAPLEFVGLALAAIARVAGPSPQQLSGAAHRRADPVKGTRSVYFREADSRMETTIYDRRLLAAGDGHPGPAVIEEYGSTTIVGPFDRFSIGDLGEINIYLG